jgi:hypothetical protein
LTSPTTGERKLIFRGESVLGGLRGLATGGLVLGKSSHCRSVFRNVLSFDGHIFLAKAGVIIY